MALDLLFPNFDELIRTPEDVQRLNETILKLAVRGKLVPQDPNDEPASELGQRMQAEREHRENTGTIKARRASVLRSDSVPYELPKGWIWTRFSMVADFVVGKTPPTKQVQYWDENGAPWVSISDMSHYGLVKTTERKISDQAISDFMAGKRAPKGTLLMSFKLTVGKVALLGVDAFHNEAIISIFPFCGIEQRYLYWFLPVFAQGGRTKGAIKGATLNSESLADLLIPLPPLAEQHRIVAKVDELFAQTRALEARLRLAQEDVVTVNRAALHRLHTAQDDDQFQAAWRTLRDHFDVLYDDPRNVAELRQAILDLAVRGKLVAQDPEDEPAEELLRQIEAEKKRLVQEKEIGKWKPMPPIRQREMPFELPHGWCWSRLGDAILEIQTGPFGSTLHKSDYVEGGVPVVNPVNIRDGRIEPLANMAVSKDTKKRLERYVLDKGDIVMGRRGEMGRCAVVTEREAGWLCGSGSFNLKTSSNMSQEYLVRLIRAPHVRLYLSGGSVGSTMNNLNHRILGRMVIGVPPLAEQQRIVAKVDQLMRLCDALEAGLAQAESQRRKLVAAVLQTQ